MAMNGEDRGLRATGWLRLVAGALALLALFQLVAVAGKSSKALAGLEEARVAAAVSGVDCAADIGEEGKRNSHSGAHHDHSKCILCTSCATSPQIHTASSPILDGAIASSTTLTLWPAGEGSRLNYVWGDARRARAPPFFS